MYTYKEKQNIFTDLERDTLSVLYNLWAGSHLIVGIVHMYKPYVGLALYPHLKNV